MGAATVLMLLALAAGQVPHSAAGAPDVFVEVFASNGFINDWHIAVSDRGEVHISTFGTRAREWSYRLAPSALASLRSALDRERAAEISGAIGVAIADGPLRAVTVSQGGKATRFSLNATPSGLARSVRTDAGVLGRAVRICERVRLLGVDSSLASCVDERQ